MAVIDELRQYVETLKQTGSIRPDAWWVSNVMPVPPKADEKYFHPIIETMPRDKLLKITDERIRHTVKWAYEKSEFYRKMYDKAKVSPDEIKGYDDLPKLPMFRKGGKWGLRTDQIENPPFGIRAVKELLPYVVNLFMSTGVTGKPTYQPWTAEEWTLVVEGFARGFWTYGARPESATWVPVGSDRFHAGGHFYNDGMRRLGGIPLHYGATPFVADTAGSVRILLELSRGFNPPFIYI
jgi:phenylacetate-coenzyme A ligase PaaK-like adenylate-forming protein